MIESAAALRQEMVHTETSTNNPPI